MNLFKSSSCKRLVARSGAGTGTDTRPEIRIYRVGILGYKDTRLGAIVLRVGHLTTSLLWWTGGILAVKTKRKVKMLQEVEYRAEVYRYLSNLANKLAKLL